MKLKLAILALALSTNLFAIDLDEGQLERITKVYKVSKLFKAKDGTTFEQAMSGIYLRESSAGIYNIGDKYEDKYYYKHTTNGKTSEIFIDKYNVIPINNSMEAEEERPAPFGIVPWNNTSKPCSIVDPASIK